MSDTGDLAVIYGPHGSCRSMIRAAKWLAYDVCMQELALAANVVEKNFLEDKSVIKTDEFLKINPTGKWVAVSAGCRLFRTDKADWKHNTVLHNYAF